MKKIIAILLILGCHCVYSQNPPVTSTVAVCSGISYDEIPQNSYFKDIFNTFDPFVGTWVYVNGNQKVTLSIKKVTKKYFADRKIYKDFIVGNYSYSTDGGITYVVNTIPQFLNTNPDSNPMYSPCAEANLINFGFIDVLLDKHFCKAIFEFLPGSTTQVKLTLQNEGTHGVLINEGETFTPTNPDFTIPNNIVLTKQ